MKKTFARIVCLILAMLMLTTGAMAEVLKVDLPLVEEPVTLKVLTRDSPSTKTFSKASDAPVWKYLSETTGITFEVESYTQEDLKTKLSLIMADPDNLPDIFWTVSGLDDESVVTAYGSQGLLLNLTDELVDKYMPTLRKIWDMDPSWRSYAASGDGNVYALPYYTKVNKPNTFMVNDVWMKNCGITEYPTNLDEFKEMLIKFRDMDANGNGDPNDEIPLNGNMTSLVRILMNAVGMMADGPYIGALYTSDKGSTTAIPMFMDERYKYVISYMADLYAEGLLENDMFTRTSDEQTVRRLSDQYGVLPQQTWPNVEEKYDPNNFTAIPLLTSKYLDEPVGFVTPSYYAAAAAISGKTENVEAACRFLDYCLTADGTALFGNAATFDMEATGISPEVQAVLSDYLADNHMEWYANSGTTFLPQLLNPNATYANNIQLTIAENITAKYTDIGNVLPEYTKSLKFTEAEAEVIAQYKNDIDTYVKQKVNEWIVNGQIEAEWDAYIAQIEAMGVDKLTEVHQAAVNRWYGVE